MKKLVFPLVLFLACVAQAVPPYPTVWYREKAAQHERVPDVDFRFEIDSLGSDNANPFE